MGDSKKRDPWFWHVVMPQGLSKEQQKEWSLDSENIFRPLIYFTLIKLNFDAYPVDRVKWFRERADRNRFREEVDILEAEFERTTLSHMRMTKVWTQLADRYTPTHPGSAAYAHKKAHMYLELAKECSEAYIIARKQAGRPAVPSNTGMRWDWMAGECETQTEAPPG